jgi:protein ImuB
MLSTDSLTRPAAAQASHQARRVMAVWCPDWPVVAAMTDLPRSAAAAVFDKGLVLACTPAARADGVRRGMRRRDAQARCPELAVLDYNPAADVRAFEPVLAVIEELTPGVAPLRPGLCALPVPDRYYGGEVEAGAVLAERLVDAGVWDCRIGVADGLFTAEQAARRALPQESFVVAPDGSAAFLRGLPVRVLDDPELVSLLDRLGLATLGDFASLSANDVQARFGRHGAFLHRLARGLDARPVTARSVPPELSVSLTFEPPLELSEQVAFSTRRSAELFVRRLADLGLVCTAVRIEADADGVLACARSWLHPRWFRSTDLLDRLRWQLQVEGAVPAPVDGVRLVPQTVEPLDDHAESLFGNAPDERVEHGVARVQSMVGYDGVVAPVVQGGRGPADRQLLVPWGERAVATRPRSLPWPGSLPPPAPATVFPAPVEALVVGDGGQPVRVSDRGMVSAEPTRFRATADAGLQPVAAWAGPWPIDEQWWDEHAARRVARFQVVGVDGIAWLMVVQDGHWWTEARYD